MLARILAAHPRLATGMQPARVSPDALFWTYLALALLAITVLAVVWMTATGSVTVRGVALLGSVTIAMCLLLLVASLWAPLWLGAATALVGGGGGFAALGGFRRTSDGCGIDLFSRS